MTSPFLAGFALSLSLILAIGAQNAFVLRQGLRRQHVLPVVLTCAISDAILITAGVTGFSWIAESAPWIQPLFRWGGAAFLIVYGALSFRNALRGGEVLEAAGNGEWSLRATILTCLALTWLNPHVYLDTLVLIGSVSTEYPGEHFAFGLGAVLASFVFFFTLGYGARLLAPVFAKPTAWRLLDVAVGTLMWVIAITLILDGQG
jgi:L-lysine exporter family protein LysE/ArgO